MSLMVCVDCTTRYAVGLTSCPHCHSGRALDAYAADRAVERVEAVGAEVEGAPPEEDEGPDG